MRTRVDAGLASSAHQHAFARAETRHEATATRALDRLMRSFVRASAASFERHHLVLTAAAGDPPAWRMPIPADLMDTVHAQAELEAKAKVYRDKVAVTTSKAMAIELGIDPTLSNLLLRGVIAGQAGMHITTAPSDLVGSMMESLQASYDAGHSIPKAAREMRKAGYARSRSYAERIARTELIGAVNAASLAQVQGATTIPYKLWMATGDQRTRPTHKEADGQTVPIDAAFSVGGHRLEYPGDPSGPGEEVIMCRCTMGYVDEPRGLATIAGGTMAATDTTTKDGVEVAAVGASWSGVIAQEGVDTGDGRRIEPGALNWRELPMPLMSQLTASHGVGDPGPSSVGGRIETIDRNGNDIVGGGVFDTAEAGLETERLVREEMLNGISIDLAINKAEIIPDPDAEDEIEAMFLGTLNVLDGTILGATVVPFPAFENARIAIVAGAAMRLAHFRRVDDRTVASFVMPFAPFPTGDGGGGDDETDPADASTDADEAIADITDAVNGWPGLNGDVVITIDGNETTVPFPPATPSGAEPGEDGAAISPEVLAALSALRAALRKDTT